MGQMGTGRMGTEQQMTDYGRGGTSMLARGGSVLAGSLLVLLGLYHFFAGIAGLARENFYVVGQNYVYQLSSTGWGWIHLIGGVLLVATGLALFSRTATWAQPVAIVLLVASAFTNFFFLAYFPLWALLMIAIAVFCIWAIAREGTEQRQAQAMAGRAAPGAWDMRDTQQAGSQTGRGAQQQAASGTYGSQQPSSSYGAAQSGQRWPENVSGQEQPSGRSWADTKESASRLGDKAQEQAAQGARNAGQAGRNAAEEAADRARQATGQGQGQNYRSGR